MTSDPSRSEGEQQQCCIHKDTSRKLISSSSLLVTEWEQWCFTHLKPLQVKRHKKEEKSSTIIKKHYAILRILMDKYPPLPLPQERCFESSHKYDIDTAENNTRQETTISVDPFSITHISCVLPCYDRVGIVFQVCSACTYHNCLF